MALMSLAISLIAVAEPITESQARSIAAQFLAGQNTRPMTLRRAATHTTAAPDSHAAYYIFNTGGPSDGYVIIAGDDQAIPVLGHSDAGRFDNDNVPPAMQEMLDGYAAQIAAMQEGAMAAPSIPRVAISPLVNAQWNQRQPYNILLPKINGERVLAGCVAIAMAQVMHYWQWPASIDGPIPPYTSKTNGINMGELPATSFNWSMMQNSYLTSDTLSGNSTAVAKLVLYCAQALKMDFGTSASSAYTPDITYLLSEYFGYHSGIHTISRESFTTQGWEDAIYAELAENRPLSFRAEREAVVTPSCATAVTNTACSTSTGAGTDRVTDTLRSTCSTPTCKARVARKDPRAISLTSSLSSASSPEQVEPAHSTSRLVT